MDELLKVTLDSLLYLADDFFNKIILYDNKVVSGNYQERSDGRYQVNVEVEVKKIEADGYGAETAIPLDDYIYLGVYNEEDEFLDYKQVKINSEKDNFSIIVNQKPAKVGIDPQHLLIDKTTGDNVTSIELLKDQEGKLTGE